ncbi:MAG: Glucose-6-phosphate isomerase [Chlamydiae bacterium]|nr:Glucose-6-phosphate isomerase [Chlamydiota bacterium]
MTLVKDQQMSRFLRYQSTQKLQRLAEKPFDLTAEGNLTPERLRGFYAESCGYRLLYGLECVTDEVMQALGELSQEARVPEKMGKMQAGEVMNFIEGYPSEERAVLHTAVRDFFAHPNPSEVARKASQVAKEEIEKLRAFIEEIDRESRFTDLIMIGIGGSNLGPKANFLALRYLQKPDRNVHFISNVDPDDAAMVLRGLNLRKSLVVVVSKSGTTLETSTNEEFVKSRFVAAGLKPEEHFIAVTGKGSPMDNTQKYLKCFYIWDWVGGRFSSSSVIGGVMTSFACGFPTYWEMLEGANAMDKAALDPDLKKNLPLLAALLGIWNHNFLGYPTEALIPYSQGLERYSAHIQQVVMESNGKRIDRKGQTLDFQTCPIVWGEPGTNAQHSFFQLIHQGTEVVPMEFIGFKEGQTGEDFEGEGTTAHQKLLSNMFAQALSLATGKKDDNPNKVFPGNRPSHILLGNRLTPFSLGALLSFVEHKVAFQGFIWDINSFDQEGVQLGKVLAEKIINRFAARNGKGPDRPYPLGDALIEHLDKLK